MINFESIGAGRLQGRSALPVKSLAGYRKGTRTSDAVTAAAKAFVAKLAADDVAAEIDRVRGGLRDIFRFKRKDLDSGSGDDGGWITTPYFDYHVHATLENDPEIAVFVRELSNVRDAAKLADVEELFAGVFDRVAMVFPEDVDLVAVVDAVEDADHANIRIDYDQDVTWCRITMHGLNGTIHMVKRGLTFESNDRTISGLLASFAKVRSVLFESPKGPTLPLLS